MRQKSFFLLLVLFTITLLIPGCAAKKMSKKAQQYEAAGMYAEATEQNYQAMLKKPKDADIRIALQRTAQLYIENLAENIAQAYNKGDYKTCIYDFLSARDLVKKLKPQGVKLNINHEMNQQFEDAKVYYLEDRYELGQKEIGDQNFSQAKGIFQEISRIDPDYKETRSYLKQAKYEPIYQEGARLFDEGEYMQAYRKWNSVFTQEKSYKDIDQRMRQALDERYKEGALLLMDEDFGDAATVLGEVFNADNNYKDVKILYTEARNEPIYRRANLMMEDGLCRTAYFEFSTIVNNAGEYKNSKALKDDALACAQYPIAIQSPTVPNHSSAVGRFQTMLSDKILDYKNPFIKVFDLAAINSRANQKLNNTSGSIDQTTLNQLASQNNIKAVLLLDFTTYAPSEGEKIQKVKQDFNEQWSDQHHLEIQYLVKRHLLKHHITIKRSLTVRSHKKMRFLLQ